MNPAGTVQDLLTSLWRRAWVRLLAYALLLTVSVWLAGRLRAVLWTAAAAYALAYVAGPLLVWLEGRGVRRAYGVLLVALAGLTVATGLAWVVVAQLVNLLNDAPRLAAQLGSGAADVLSRLARVPGLEQLPQGVSAFLTAQGQALGADLGPTVSRVLASGGTLLGGAASVASWAAQGAFVIVLSLYFMLDAGRAGAGLLRTLPASWQPAARTLAGDVSVSFGAFLRGQLLIGAAVGLLIALGLTALRVPDALAIGLLAGVLNVVPYLGPVVAAVPAVLLAWPGGWVTVLLAVLVFVAANQLESSVLSPFILGRTTHLAPAAVLLAVLAGLTLGGVVGALLAIPTVTLLWRWLDRSRPPTPVSREPDPPPT